jgi:LacI family transcriptional regulator
LNIIQFYGVVAIGINAENFLNWGNSYAQPLVVLDRELPRPIAGVWQVSSDERQAMELAAAHFRDHNLHKIGCLIYGAPGVGNADLRLKAARNALKKYDFPYDESLFLFAAQENCVEAVGKLLIQNVDALLCPGGYGGLFTAYALNLFGKRIPDDISMISTELSFFSAYSMPSQTALSPDYLGIAAKAVEIFHAVLAGKPFPAKTILPYSLIKRDSVCLK